MVLAAFAPVALAVATTLDPASQGLVWLWVVFGVAFMGSRAAVLVHRARGSRWMTTGAATR